MKLFQMTRVLVTRVLVVALLVGVFGWGTNIATVAQDAPAAVYVLSNSPAGNSVLAFDRAADGTPTPAGAFATGGLGSGAGLGSQGALALSNDNHQLFAVTAGSNRISAFAVTQDGLTL